MHRDAAELNPRLLLQEMLLLVAAQETEREESRT